jgi:hypothetical protein
MAWNEDPPVEGNFDQRRWLRENKAREDGGKLTNAPQEPENYELHGPSEGLEIGQKDEPASIFQRCLAFFRRS